MEIWKSIDGFEGLYEVSNLGRIKCLEHKCPGRYKGRFRTVKEHIMKITKNKANGYYYVILSNSDRGKTFAVHRLVAQAFLENPDNLPCVNHKDENKQNNNVQNLEWCTPLYNNTYNDVHKNRKRYTHKIDYDKNKMFKKFNSFLKDLDIFKLSYPNNINECIDEMIEVLKCQKS